MSTPTLTYIEPHAFISVEARVMLWGIIRDVAHEAGCTCEERRIGWITKKFVIRGDLQKFINLAWDHPDLGDQFRREFFHSVVCNG